MNQQEETSLSARLDVYLHHMHGVERKLEQILVLLKLNLKELQMSKQEVADLVAEVQEVKTVEESASVALTGVIAKLEAAVGDNPDPAVSQALADLKASTADLAAAVATVPVDQPGA